jgi:hypothetical protein
MPHSAPRSVAPRTSTKKRSTPVGTGKSIASNVIAIATTASEKRVRRSAARPWGSTSFSVSTPPRPAIHLPWQRTLRQARIGSTNWTMCRRKPAHKKLLALPGPVPFSQIARAWSLSAQKVVRVHQLAGKDIRSRCSRPSTAGLISDRLGGNWVLRNADHTPSCAMDDNDHLGEVRTDRGSNPSSAPRRTRQSGG